MDGNTVPCEDDRAVPRTCSPVECAGVGTEITVKSQQKDRVGVSSLHELIIVTYQSSLCYIYDYFRYHDWLFQEMKIKNKKDRI